MKNILWFLVFISVSLGILAWQGWERYERFLHTPLSTEGEGQIFLVEQGASGAEIVQQLGAAGLTWPGWEWRLLMRLEPSLYRAGEYRIEAGTLPRQFLEKLSAGRVIQYRFTLVEGWTFNQLAAALAANPILVKELNFANIGSWEPGSVLQELSTRKGGFCRKPSSLPAGIQTATSWSVPIPRCSEHWRKPGIPAT
jgi:cell division protein YceG involved in septum cleavage